jgi:recombinational DNA repair protein RecR
MLEYAEPVTKLIDELKRLPSIGHKSAQRLAFHIMRTPDSELERLITAILEVNSASFSAPSVTTSPTSSLVASAPQLPATIQ